MFLKFESVSGDCLGKLLLFVHSDENRVQAPLPEVLLPPSDAVIRVKLVQVNQIGDGHCTYDIGLQILEWVPNSSGQKINHVDSKYLLKVYEILGGAM